MSDDVTAAGTPSGQAGEPQPPATDPASPDARSGRAEKPARALSPWSLLLGGAVLAALLLGQWVWLVAILGLALLIMVHEFGHFIAAKSFGMRVEKFYVGFPPAALRRTWGETEYGIGIIPLGGFCKISGMTPEEEVPEGTGDRVYYKKAIWKRNITIAAGPLMNFARRGGHPHPLRRHPGRGPGTDAHARARWRRAVRPPRPGSSPATRSWARTARRSRRGTRPPRTSAPASHKSIELTYQPASGGPEKTVTVTLAPKPGEPKVGYLGVSPVALYERPGPVKAVTLGLTGFKDVVVGTFTGFWWLLSGKISATGPDGAVGPVGIVNVSRQAVEQSWYPILLAFLSFNLGLINLLPILPFDGGHIAMNVVEKIRGRRLDSRVFERMVAFGTVLLVMLFIFLTFNDVKRLFGG